jgi:DNA repair exonuclease SbcCD ATPase subunit
VASPSIALASLSIRDFRGIDRLDLDFRGPDGLPNSLVVLAGPNGSGKTTVLEAALIAAAGHKLAVGPSGQRGVRKGAKDYEIEAEFDRGPVGLKFKTRATSEIVAEPPQPVQHWYFSSWRAPELVGPVDVTVGKAGRQPVKNDANRLKNVKRLLVNAAAKAHFRSGQRALLSRHRDWMDAINGAWSEFYPDRSGEFVVDLADSEQDEGGAFDVFHVRPDGTRLEVDLLSAGQLELFLFLAALVVNDDREGIVFIDEPELHLDPQWHRPIVRSLVRLQPRAQFIVATHSPEIFDSAQSYERHYLVPEDDPRSHLWRSIEAGA